MDRRRLPDIESVERHPITVDFVSQDTVRRFSLVDKAGKEDRVLFSCGTTRRFFQIVNTAHTEYCKQVGLPADKRLMIGKAKPPITPASYIDVGYVQCSTLSVIPASMSQKGAPYTGMRLRAWREYGAYKDPDKPDRAIRIYRREYDSWVQFTIYAKTEDKADRLSDWFMEFMDTFSFYFAYSGVSKVWFERREGDDTWEDDNYPSPLSVRPLVYFVRLSKVSTRTCAILNNVNINLAIAGQQGVKSAEVSGGIHNSILRQTGDMT